MPYIRHARRIFDLARPEKSAGGSFRSRGLKQTDALHFPCHGRLRAESADMLSAARNLFVDYWQLNKCTNLPCADTEQVR